MTIATTTMRISTLGAFQDVRRRAALATAPAPKPVVDTYVPSPVRPASLPKPRPAGALEGFGLKVGSTYAIAPGTTVKGQTVTGTARVVAVGPDHVELRMKGAAAGGLVNFDVRFKAAKQADGSVKLTANMDGGPMLLDQRAKVLKAAAGDLQLRTADGKAARLAVANRGLNIQVDDMNLQLVRTA